jgi:hypothetical protein
MQGSWDVLNLIGLILLTSSFLVCMIPLLATKENDMTELDFNQDPAELVDYVVDKIHLAESGDERAINYIEFLWGENPELLEVAYEAFYEETV